ncbi:MAG TPA: hypothetical protein VGA58_10000 [bacterium]
MASLTRARWSSGFISITAMSGESTSKTKSWPCDALLLGRVTHEMLAPYWSSLKQNEMGIADKMNGASKYVASSTLKNAEWNNSAILSGNIVGQITKLKCRPFATF